MKTIPSAFCHINLQPNLKNATGKDWTKPYKLEEILKSPPMRVSSYSELVKNVAQLQYHNRHLTLFFRGQTKDHRDKQEKSTILASIFRKGREESTLNLKKRFVELNVAVDLLRKAFNSRAKKLSGTHLLNKYEEVAWSILQHYLVCPTPLIDITHSLHVACSFAFDGNEGKTGIVYVLGMPWPSDAISFSTYEELINIRLLNICPPQAQRPFFQEGYLLGNFPNYRLDDPTRIKQFDPARRIIAKFEVPISQEFWGDGFQRIPEDMIYPVDDLVKEICEKIKSEL